VPTAQPTAEELPSATAAPLIAIATPETPTPSAPPRIGDLSALAVASASSTLPAETLPKLGLVRYDSGNALDRNPATAWVEGVGGPGVGEQLVFTFLRPVTLVRLGFDIGFDRDDRIFAANNRVRRAMLLFSDGSVQQVEFLDQRGMQYLSLADVTTTKLTVVIDAVYPGTKYDDTCIAGVEIWGYEAQ
jgi:hypothetical protein